RHSHGPGHALCDPDPEQYPNDSTYHRQGHCFYQELQQHVGSLRAHRLADSHLSRTLGHSHQHDVHDHNSTHHHRDGGNPDHGDEKCSAQVRPDTQQAAVGLDIKAVTAARRIVPAHA